MVMGEKNEEGRRKERVRKNEKDRVYLLPPFQNIRSLLIQGWWVRSFVRVEKEEGSWRKKKGKNVILFIYKGILDFSCVILLSY